ncbi:hypothetical protein BDV33DRAFT_210180 [Aspergillus novoparasiticus]|uniref:Uncharacterized protein n=1 Tax=Aspergillus novoparasiticus TaxID=986946 RepID=A0A5N6E9K0_9EURO|nr:hypothetical protein BDV33DRAFT_210180 [Aspergillus novoparasiticus]
MGEALRDSIKLLNFATSSSNNGQQSSTRETYHGILRDENDFLVLCEASLLGFIPMLTHADLPSDIRSGSIFVWSEDSLGTSNLEDWISWQTTSPLPYSILYKERGGNLLKQHFRLATSTKQRICVLSYLSISDLMTDELKRPTRDISLSHLSPQRIQDGYTDGFGKNPLRWAEVSNLRIPASDSRVPFLPPKCFERYCTGALDRFSIKRLLPFHQIPQQGDINASSQVNRAIGQLKRPIQAPLGRTELEAKLIQKLNRAFVVQEVLVSHSAYRHYANPDGMSGCRV